VNRLSIIGAVALLAMGAALPASSGVLGCAPEGEMQERLCAEVREVLEERALSGDRFRLIVTEQSAQGIVARLDRAGGEPGPALGLHVADAPLDPEMLADFAQTLVRVTLAPR